MADDILTKRAAELREQGRRKRGMPRLRWEDCVKSRLVLKCGLAHLNANANARDESNANANASAQHLNQMQMRSS